MANILPDDSISKLERMVEEFDQNMKIIDFYIDTENYFDLNLTNKNITKMNNLLADSSRMVFICIKVAGQYPRHP
jgi:hypothetical protein